MNYYRFEIQERVWRRWMDLRHRFVYADQHFPKMLAFETDTFCNRACPYCPQSVIQRPRQKMDESTFEIMCQRVKELNYRGKVVLSWLNEPLFDTRLVGFIARMKAAAPLCRPCVFTNGDLLTKEKMGELIVAGVYYVNITKHPPFSKNWDTKIADLRKQFPRHIQYRGQFLNKPWLFNWNGTTPNPPNATKWKTCVMISWNLLAHYDGAVRLCACLTDETPVVGNLIHEDILSVWRKPEFVAMRKQARSGRPTLEPCKKCYNRTA